VTSGSEGAALRTHSSSNLLASDEDDRNYAELVEGVRNQSGYCRLLIKLLHIINQRTDFPGAVAVEIVQLVFDLIAEGQSRVNVG